MTNKVKKPHIIIDARLYGPKHTGLGRYTKNLLVALDPTGYKYTLIVYPELLAEIKKDLGDKFSYVVTNLRHYSLSEQIFLPFLLQSLHPDLVHFTHLDKPIFYFGKSIVTVHDLIRHFSRGMDTTTKSQYLYWPKYFGYLLMTRIILWTSKIIVPSNFWRDYIIEKYNYNPRNIVTTYEAVDPSFLKICNLKLVIGNYILYTGNLYPHKNIDIILKALPLLPNLKLKIICARSVFTKRIDNLIDKYKIHDQVDFLGFVPDLEFPQLYSQALALVHPSLLEGFSLTGLEAMSLHCPVIAAKASCLPEIYQDSVLYFDPYNTTDLVAQINKLKNNPKLRDQLIKKGISQVKKYSWTKTASETLNFYKKCLK